MHRLVNNRLGNSQKSDFTLFRGTEMNMENGSRGSLNSHRKRHLQVLLNVMT
jgi:hypothetical protein